MDDVGKRTAMLADAAPHWSSQPHRETDHDAAGSTAHITGRASPARG
jgi:hypothetical protein